MSLGNYSDIDIAQSIVWFQRGTSGESRAPGSGKYRRRHSRGRQLLVDLLELRSLNGPDQNISNDPQHSNQQPGGNT